MRGIDLAAYARLRHAIEEAEMLVAAVLPAGLALKRVAEPRPTGAGQHVDAIKLRINAWLVRAGAAFNPARGEANDDQRTARHLSCRGPEYPALEKGP